MNNELLNPTMTVKELSDTLGISKDLIKKRIRELFPDKMQNGIITHLNEEETTAIELRIKENSSLATYDDRHRLSSMPKTSLEKELIIQQAMMFQAEKIDYLQSEISVMKPKAIIHDQILDSEGLILPSIAGKIIMGKPNKFTEWCRDLGILFKRNDHGKLYPNARYQSKGYMTVKPKLNMSQNKTYDQVYFTPEGLIWITEKWNKFHPFLLESV